MLSLFHGNVFSLKEQLLKIHLLLSTNVLVSRVNVGINCIPATRPLGSSLKLDGGVLQISRCLDGYLVL